MEYFLIQTYQKKRNAFFLINNTRSIEISTSDSIRLQYVIKIDIAPNEHNCDDTITLIIIGYTQALLYVQTTIKI